MEKKRIVATLPELIQLLRPRHWVKNLFVFIGVFFGHAWVDPTTIVAAMITFFSFCAVASAVYVFNDLIDMERDRAHPLKRDRPLASGAVGPRFATVLAIFLVVVGAVLASAVSARVVVIVSTYLGINILYSTYLKHVAIADVFAISAGFMLRILAGTLGLEIEPSHWLLLTGLMLTLFLGFAKRRAELLLVRSGEGGGSASMRPVLDAYTPAMLDSFVVMTAACTILSYGLYTVSPETIAQHGTRGLFYTLPFVVYGICRYVFLLHRGVGGSDAASDLLTDSHLVFTVTGWLAVTALVLS